MPKIMGKDQDSEYARLTDGSSDSSCDCQRFEPRQPKRKKLWPWVLHGLMITGYTLGSVFFIESQCGAKPWESEEPKHVYSRLWDVVSYKTVIFLGALWTDTPYKGIPGPNNTALDLAWNQITTTNLVAIPDDALVAMNKSSTGLVRFPSGTPGGVAGKVVGAVEVFHHLHCLDLLRKKIHENYYKDKDGNWEAGPEVMRLHVDHCIDMLRQKLMCDGDVGMITYIWIKGHNYPMPDFSNTHRCRNFEKIRNWVEENKVPIEVQKIKKTENDIPVPTPV